MRGLHFVDKLRFNSNLIVWLYSLLLISFPFGASVLPISLGFFTLYPNLLVIIFLSVLSLTNLRIIKSRVERGFLLFLAVWLFYGLIQYLFIPVNSYAFYEIRSLILMLLISTNIIWLKNYFGIEKFKTLTFKLMVFIFFFISALTILEVITGIHIAGEFTEKLNHLPVGNVFYSPVFVMDNQNTFLAFFSIVGLLVLLFNSEKFSNSYLLFIFVVCIIYFLSFISSSRIVEYVSYILMVCILIFSILHFIKNKNNPTFKIVNKLILISLGMFLILIFSKPLYFGPKWQKPPLPKKMELTKLDNADINELSTLIPVEFVPLLNKVMLDTIFTSTKIRISLLANGWDYVKKSNFMGIGPGQYKYNTAINNKKYYTKTNVAPHFWLVEILSQYGILIFLIYISFPVYFTLLLFKQLKNNFEESFIHIICLGSFFLLSISPSSFIELEINWYFLCLFICLIDKKANPTE